MQNAHFPEQLSEEWAVMQNVVVSTDGARISFDSGDEPTHFRERLLATVTDAVVMGLLHDKITSINVNGCDNLTDRCMKTIAEGCPELKELHAESCSHLTDEAIKVIAKGCPELTELNVSRIESLTDESIKSIARGCPELKQLNVSSCSHITDESIKAIARGCPELEDLNVARCLKLTDESIKAIGEDCHQLKELNVQNCGNVTDKSIKAIAQGCPKLRRLNALDCIILTDEAVKAIAQHCHELKGLCVSDGLGRNSNLTDASMRALAELCPNVTELNIERSSNFTDASIKAIAHGCHELQELNVQDCANLTDEAIEAIAIGCPSLKILRANRCSWTSLPDDIGDLVRDLACLDMAESKLTSLPPSIVKLKNLQHLKVDSNPLRSPPLEIAVQGLDAIERYFKKLEYDTVVEPILMQWLRPLEFGADLRRCNRDFVEGTRQWVLDDLKAWRSDPNGSRCRVLLAGPGFGKTAIAARFYYETTGVIAIHLCRYNDGFKRDPRRMIASIAYQIADALPQFRDALREVRETEGTPASEAYSLRPTARELADCLLFTPLGEITPPHSVDEDGRRVIIIDALDEAEHDAKTDLLDLVSLDFRKFPPWVAVLITSRPEVEINTRLAPLRPTMLDAAQNKGKCVADVRVYIRRILAPKFSDEDSLIRAIDRTAAKSDGLFLYLHYIRDIIKSGDDADTLPIGLAWAFHQQLERALGSAGLGDENSLTRRVVEAIVAAQVPIHVNAELPGLSGVPHNVVRECVARLSQLLLVRDDERLYFFHKSFVDWLTRDKRTCEKCGFIVDLSAAHRRLASACSAPLMRMLSDESDRFESDAHAVAALQQLVEARSCQFEDVQQPSAAFDKYALRWSVTHLFEAGERDTGLALLHSLRFLLERAPQIDTLITDAAMLLPKTALLYRALVLAHTHARSAGAKWLAEELWQRLLSVAETRGVVKLERLARDAQIKARADLMFSARRACLTPADSPTHCVLEGHSLKVLGMTTFVDAKGYTWVASCSEDKTVRIWDPIDGGEAVHVLKGHSAEVNGVAAIVDTKGHAWVASCSTDKTVCIWDPIKGGEAVHVLKGHLAGVGCVAAHMEAKGRALVASGAIDRTVRVWDPINGGEALHVLRGHSFFVISVTFFTDAKGDTWLASCSYDTTVRIWDPIKGGEAVRALEGHSCSVDGATTFIDAKGNTWLASWSADDTVRIWDATNGGEAVHVLGHADDVNDVTVFGDAQGNMWVVSCSSDETVRVWDPVKGGEAVRVLEGHLDIVLGVTAFVDGKGRTWLASCSWDRTVSIWDPIHGGQAVNVLQGHSDWVTDVTAFEDPTGRTWMASCSHDNTVRIWEVKEGGESVHIVSRHAGSVYGVTTVVDAKGHTWVASCSDDEMLRTWDPMNGGETAHVIVGHSLFVTGLKAFLDAKGHTWLVTCSHDKTVRIWDLINGEPVHVLKGHSHYVVGVTAFVDAEGHTWVASCSCDKTVRIWDAMKGGEAKHVLQGHSHDIYGVTAFEDAKGHTWLASCARDRTVRIWDIKGGEAVHVLEGHSSSVRRVTAFMDAKRHSWLASCSRDATVRIWDPITGGEALHVLEGHSSFVMDVTAFVDFQSHAWVASCSTDRTVRIWDAINGGPASFILPQDSIPNAISTISAGTLLDAGAAQVCLVVGHDDGRLSFWDHAIHRDDSDSAQRSPKRIRYTFR